MLIKGQRLSVQSMEQTKGGLPGLHGTERSLVLPLEPPPTLTTQTPVVPLGALGSGGPARV